MVLQCECERWISQGGGEGMRVGRRKVRKKGVPDITHRFGAEKENGERERGTNLEVHMDS
jgi:hypothetical protein